MRPWPGMIPFAWTRPGTLTKGEMAVERLDPVGCTEADMRRELGRFLSAFDDPTPTLEALRRAIPPWTGW